MVSDLVHKKAMILVEEEQVKEDGKEEDGPPTVVRKVVPLNNNALIEERLGSEGVLCVDDVAAVLSAGRDNLELFDKVNSLLVPMQLSDVNFVQTIVGAGKFQIGFVPDLRVVMEKIL